MDLSRGGDRKYVYMGVSSCNRCGINGAVLRCFPRRCKLEHLMVNTRSMETVSPEWILARPRYWDLVGSGFEILTLLFLFSDSFEISRVGVALRGVFCCYHFDVVILGVIVLWWGGSEEHVKLKCWCIGISWLSVWQPRLGIEIMVGSVSWSADIAVRLPPWQRFATFNYCPED